MAEPTAIPRPDLTQLTRAAARSDERAWTDLVRRLDGVLHAVANRYGVGAGVELARAVQP
jgi:hypothetical protein